VRALEHTVKTYADQIQALALANAELAEHNQRLREQLERREPNVTRLADHR
jgi:dynactin complex subunit